MRLNNYLSEAVIKIDVTEVRKRLDNIINIIASQNYDDSAKIVKQLNRVFKAYNITFDVVSGDLIDGGTNADTLNIYVDIGEDILFDVVNDPIRIKERIIGVIKHELVHREQLKRSKSKTFFDKPFVVSRDTIGKYLADKHESMAFAGQTVDALRGKGYSDGDIIDMLKNITKWKDRLDNDDSGYLSTYIEIFGKNDSTVRRFKKYILQYLGDK